MAKIIKTNRDLEKEYQYYAKKHRKLLIIGEVFGVCWIGSFTLFFTDFPKFLGVCITFVSVLLTLYFLFASGQDRVKANIILKGIEGETITKEIIEKLPDCYVGYQNVKVTYKGETSEIDMVVVGPNGVFVIETKNLTGHIVGYETKTWIQEKIVRKGTPYSKTFYSPVKQVGTHIYRLANHLRDNGANVYVNGAVYFSNPEAYVESYPYENGIAIFSHNQNGQQELTDYILSNKTNININPLKRVHQLLNKSTSE